MKSGTAASVTSPGHIPADLYDSPESDVEIESCLHTRPRKPSPLPASRCDRVSVCVDRDASQDQHFYEVVAKDAMPQ